MTFALLAANQLEESAIWFFGLAAWALTLAVTAAAVLGLLFFVMIIAPEGSRRCGQTLSQRSFVSFIMGLPLVGLWLLGGIVIGHPAPPLGVVVLAGLGLVLTFGAAVAGEDLGRRLFFVCGKSGNRATHLMVGWIILFIASSGAARTVDEGERT